MGLACAAGQRSCGRTSASPAAARAALRSAPLARQHEMTLMPMTMRPHPRPGSCRRWRRLTCQMTLPLRTSGAACARSGRCWRSSRSRRRSCLCGAAELQRPGPSWRLASSRQDSCSSHPPETSTRPVGIREHPPPALAEVGVSECTESQETLATRFALHRGCACSLLYLCPCQCMPVFCANFFG